MSGSGERAPYDPSQLAGGEWEDPPAGWDKSCGCPCLDALECAEYVNDLRGQQGLDGSLEPCPCSCHRSDEE